VVSVNLPKVLKPAMLEEEMAICKPTDTRKGKSGRSEGALL
jgi:hypothetical protein